MNTMTFRLAPSGVLQEVRCHVVIAALPPVVETIYDRLRSGAKVVVEHIERNKVAYRIGATTLIVLFAGGFDMIAHAAPMDTDIAASTDIDLGARKLYDKLISIGKWVIIIKGGFDTINATVQGDFPQARKSALAYLMVFVILLGLPWAFDQVEALFEGL